METYIIQCERTAGDSESLQNGHYSQSSSAFPRLLAQCSMYHDPSTDEHQVELKINEKVHNHCGVKGRLIQLLPMIPSHHHLPSYSNISLKIVTGGGV